MLSWEPNWYFKQGTADHSLKAQFSPQPVFVQLKRQDWSLLLKDCKQKQTALQTEPVTEIMGCKAEKYLPGPLQKFMDPGLEHYFSERVF